MCGAMYKYEAYHASYLTTALVTGPIYIYLLTLSYSRVLTWVVEALLTTLVEGLGVCWLHLLIYGARVLGQLLPNNPSMVPTRGIVPSHRYPVYKSVISPYQCYR